MTNYFLLVNLFLKNNKNVTIFKYFTSTFIPSLVFQIRSRPYAAPVVFNTGCTFKSHGEFKNTDAKAAA